MYTPKHFQNENKAELRDFIRANGFGILVNTLNGKPWATHIPLHLETKDDDDQDVLVGHIARSNPQGQSFSEAAEVLAIFTAPHAYISSSWYSHENVPTWNYIAVHCYGTLRVIAEDELYASLQKLMDKYEAASANPMRLEEMTPELVHRQMRGIVGFEIQVNDMQASYKLSQNRNDVDYQNVISELHKQEDPNAVKIAEEMAKRRSI